MLRTIVVYPDEILRCEAKPVEDIDGHMVILAQDMAETMYLSRGIGLAAPQVGVSLSLIVADIGEQLIELYNPRIIAMEGVAVAQEGCLSVPEVMVDIERAEKLVVEGIDREGRKITLEAQDLLARVLQHEIDHLHGTLIVDRLSKFRRQFITGRLKKFRREQAART